MKTKYILYINEGFTNKRYYVADGNNYNKVLSTVSKYEMKIWIDMLGLKILHFCSYDSYDRYLEKYYKSMEIYLG